MARLKFLWFVCQNIELVGYFIVFYKTQHVIFIVIGFCHISQFCEDLND